MVTFSHFSISFCFLCVFFFFFKLPKCSLLEKYPTATKNPAMTQKSEMGKGEESGVSRGLISGLRPVWFSRSAASETRVMQHTSRGVFHLLSTLNLKCPCFNYCIAFQSHWAMPTFFKDSVLFLSEFIILEELRR